MAKGSRGRRRIASRQFRPTPYPLPSGKQDVSEVIYSKKSLDKKDWEDATCSVCMEYPHNAVLLLCSSHDKGCRPYMCGTSFRYSNCLDQYKKAYTKVTSTNLGQPLDGSDDNPIMNPVTNWPVEKGEVTELACPLCRGQVKGWTVVEPAREYLNSKKRSCMQDNCSFVGNYKELRKHVRAEHPCAQPREVDPMLEQKWRRLERERERDDVISTIRSSMPGAVVFGDYVIEGNRYDVDSDEVEHFDADAVERNEGYEMGFDNNWVNVFLLLHAFGPAGNIGLNRRLRLSERGLGALDVGAMGRIHETSPADSVDENDIHNSDDDNGDNGGISLADRRRRRARMLLGQSIRRRRRREPNGGPR